MFEPWANPGDQMPHIKVNEALATLQGVAVYGLRPQASSGLTWGYHGGRWGGFLVADGTLALTASASNHIVVAKATGVVSVLAANTNWNNTTDYARVYLVPTDAAGPITATVEDHRVGPGGVLFGGGASSVSITITDAMTVTVKTVADESIRLATAIPFAGTITAVTTDCASGTATLTTKINGTSIGATNAVSTTEATQSHSDAFAAGDDIDIEFTANGACLMANVTITYTRVVSS